MYVFFEVTLAEFGLLLGVFHCKRLKVPKSTFLRKKFKHIETTTELFLCRLQRGTLICRKGLKRCFEGFFSSRNCLIINFYTSWCYSCDSSRVIQWMVECNLASRTRLLSVCKICIQRPSITYFYFLPSFD